MDYALGNLPEAFETILTAHVGTCCSCRSDVALAERLGGEMLARGNVSMFSIRVRWTSAQMGALISLSKLVLSTVVTLSAGVVLEVGCRSAA